MEEKTTYTENIEKKNGKKIAIIVAIVLIVIIIAAISGYFAYQYIEDNKSTGTEWGDIYYEHLRTVQTQENFNGEITETKLQFVQLEEDKNPAMLIDFKLDGKKVIAIYQIEDNNTTSMRANYQNDNKELDTQWLYNIEKEEYGLYKHATLSNDSETFIDIKMESEMNKKDIANTKYYNSNEYKADEEKTKYSFTKEEMKQSETTVSKFEETFIVLDNVVESEKIEIEDIKDLDKIKEKITEGINGYKDITQTITEEAKQSVQDKTQELENKKEIVKKTEEEKKKQEEEAKKKAEEVEKSLKVGNYTIKYGTYVGYSKSYDVDGVTQTKITIKINSNGTLTQIEESGQITTVNYTVQYGQIIGSNGMPLRATANNTLVLEVGGSITLNYQGN